MLAYSFAQLLLKLQAACYMPENKICCTTEGLYHSIDLDIDTEIALFESTINLTYSYSVHFSHL